MGYFTDGLGLSAGATLGSLATQSAFMFGGQVLNQRSNAATEQHRAQHYDPTVRRDLAHIMVLGRLEQFDCPFPKEQKEVSNIFLRHKGLTVLLVLIVYLFYRGNHLYKTDPSGTHLELVGGLLLLMYVLPAAFIAAIILSLIKKGRKYTDAGVYRSDLLLYGQQYWHIREYVRQALELGQLSVQEGINKLCNTALVSQFPDSVEEIEANAFFFEQELAKSEQPQ